MQQRDFFHNNYILFSILLTVLYPIDGMFAQGMSRGPRFNRERSSQLHYESLILPASHPDSLDYHFYLQIAHDQLQFVLDSEKVYNANFEITAAILSENRTVISNQVRLGKITENHNINENKKVASEIEYFHFRMPKIEFKIYFELFDLETRRSIYSEDKISPPSIPSIYLSEIFFFQENEDSTPTPSTLHPILPVTRSEIDSTLKAVVFITFTESDSFVTIRRSLMTSDGKTVINDTTDFQLNKSIQPLLLHLPEKLDFGSYQLSFEVLNESVTQTRKQTFFVNWGEINSWIPDLQLAIESLVHVIDEDEIEKTLMRTREEQEVWLKDFWNSRNPNPDRMNNPLQQEFYRRVMTANKQLSVPGANQPGWKTERGNIYMIYGAPSDIDRPQIDFGESAQYEIWFYRNIQKRFVFMDKFGNGDYLLVSQE
ncbi:GWxTD domain-containing protein [candidate division KSB1 bacterium]|nr:GWxTD domain-containing protein [candidate division KSB1 bacterium]